MPVTASSVINWTNSWERGEDSDFVQVREMTRWFADEVESWASQSWVESLVGGSVGGVLDCEGLKAKRGRLAGTTG